MSNTHREIRIFISSPGDVTDERQQARRVIERLQREYPQTPLVPLLWEDLALPATFSFQETIDHLLGQRSVDVAVFILWSRLGSPLGIATVRPDGSPYRSGTEREFDLMLAAFEQSGRQRPVILAYTRDDDAGFRKRLTEAPGSELEEMIAQRKLAESFIREQFFDSQGRNLRALQSYKEPIGFAQRLRVHLRHALDDLLGANATPHWSEEPYRGLEVFDIPHAAIFHGRDEETCDLLQRLRDQNRGGCAFVVIVGASGSGKSSLARAGVAAALLQHAGDDEVQEWRSANFVPSLATGDLLTALTRTLAEALPEIRDDSTALAEITTGLRKDPGLTVNLSIAPAAVRAGRESGRPVRVFLVLDQMEELWTDRRITPEDRQRFLAAIEALARSGHCTVLATLRSDFYPQAQQMPEFLRLKAERGHCDLLPPAAAALQRLIVEPARLAGLGFERDESSGRTLDEVILRDATHDPSVLPLLQYTLSELYHQRDTNRRLLTFAAYEALGGVEGALARRADELFQSLPDDAREALIEILPLLVTVDIRGEQAAVRRRAPLSELTATPSRKLLTERLMAARMLTSDRQDELPVAALAHEALLRRWDRIAGWITANREHLRLRARVEQSQLRWERFDQDASLLLPEGLPLEEGRQLLGKAPQLLGAGTEEYLRRSIEHHERHARMQRRRRRVVVTTLGIFAIVASVAGILAMNRGNALQSTIGELNDKTAQLVAKSDELEVANQNLIQTTQEAQWSAEAAVDAQLVTLETTFQTSIQGVENLANSAELELRGKYLANAIQYSHAAELTASQQRAFLVDQIRERLEAVKTKPNLAALFQEPLGSLEERVLNSKSLDPARWAHQTANLVRQFPEIQWRRQLQREVIAAALSPNRAKLLLLTKVPTSSESVLVWDLTENRSTECYVELPQSIYATRLAWSHDSRSFFSIVNASSDGITPSARTEITRYDAHSGRVLAKNDSHQGLVNVAACSSTGVLTVINTHDGTAPELQTFLSQLVNSEQVSPDTTSSPGFLGRMRNLFGGNQSHGATVTQYAAEDLTVQKSRTFDGMINSASITESACAISAYLRPGNDNSSEKIQSRRVLLRFDSWTELWIDDAKSTGIIGLSDDGRYLVSPAQDRGMRLYSCEPDKLTELATFGSAQISDRVQLHVEAARTENEVVHVLLAESDDASTSSPGAAVVGHQRLVSYAYLPSRKKVHTSLAVSLDNRVESTDITVNGNDNNIVAVGLQDRSAQLWQLNGNNSLTPPLDLSANCLFIGFLDNADFFETEHFRIVTLTSDGEITCWNLRRNGLGETIEFNDVARSRPLNFNRAVLQPLRFALSPDERTIAHWTPDWKQGSQYPVILRDYQKTPDGNTEEDIFLLLGFFPETVLFTADSRYALFIQGVIQKPLSSFNPLLEIPLSASGSDLLGASHPRRSNVAIYDIQENILVGEPLEYDGPIVDVQMLPNSNDCIIGYLSEKMNQGQIVKLNLADQAQAPLIDSLFPFADFSVTADLASIVAIDRRGRPFRLREKHSGEHLLNKVPSFSVVQFCNQAVISDSGKSLLMSFLDSSNHPIVINLQTDQSQRLSVPASELPSKIFAVPHTETFLLTTGAGHMLLVDGETCAVVREWDLGSRIVNAAFNSTGSMLALCTLDSQIHVFDSHNWNHQIPAVTFPFLVESSTFNSHGLKVFEFSSPGNLILGDSFPLRVRLAQPGQNLHQRVKSLVRRPLAIQILCGTSDDDGAEKPEDSVESSMDWFDAYAWAIKNGAQDPKTALQHLRRFQLQDIANPTFAVRSAFMRISLGVTDGDTTACREGLSFLTSDRIAISDLSASDARGLVANLYWFDVDGSLATIQQLRDDKHLVFNHPFFGGALKLFDARGMCARQQFDQAISLYQDTFAEPSFKFGVAGSPRIFQPIFVESALAELHAGNSLPEVLVKFNDFPTNRDPELEIGRRFLAYLAGSGLENDVDLSGQFSPSDPRVILFHRFCESLQIESWDEALAISQQLVELSTTVFHLRPQRPLFPVTRSHCRLFKAEALMNLKRKQAAQEEFKLAEEDWTTYEMSAVQHGIDLRSLWVEKVGYQLLRSRLTKRLSTSTELL